MLEQIDREMESWKHAVAALKVFAVLRGSENFNLATEAAELIKVLAGPRIIPTFDEREAA